MSCALGRYRVRRDSAALVLSAAAASGPANRRGLTSGPAGVRDSLAVNEARRQISGVEPLAGGV